MFRYCRNLRNVHKPCIWVVEIDKECCIKCFVNLTSDIDEMQFGGYFSVDCVGKVRIHKRTHI